MTTPARCHHCDAPAVEQAGHVLIPHLSWCPRSARPADRRTILPTTPDVDDDERPEENDDA